MNGPRLTAMPTAACSPCAITGYSTGSPTHPCRATSDSRVNSALESARIYDDTLVFNLGRVDHPEIVAEMADLLLRAEGVELVLGIGESAGEGVLSLRTSNLSVNAGTLIQQITAGFGSSGGHGLVAGGQLPKVAAKLRRENRPDTELVYRLLTALGRESVLPRPLLPV